MWRPTRKTLIRNSVTVLLEIAFLYVLLAPVVATPLYNSLLFFPTKATGYDVGNIPGIEREDVFFPSTNGKRLHGWYFTVPDAKGTVLISHGNGGNISHRLQIVSMLVRNHFNVLAYDYQGYGRSEGSPSISGILEDGRAAYDYLVITRHVKPETMVLFGESLGGAVAARLAKERTSAGLILQSSFSSLCHVASSKIMFLKLYPGFLYPDTLDTAAVVKNYRQPLLIAHGSVDQIVAPAEAELVYAASTGPKTIVRLPHANHNDIFDTDFDQYDGAVKMFLDELGLPPPNAVPAPTDRL